MILDVETSAGLRTGHLGSGLLGCADPVGEPSYGVAQRLLGVDAGGAGVHHEPEESLAELVRGLH